MSDCAMIHPVTSNDWIVPLIAGAAGVFGAAVGLAGTVWLTLRRERQSSRAARNEALIHLYAATNSLGHFWFTWADLRASVGGGTLGDVRLGVRMIGSRNLILARMFGVLDSFWEATASAITAVHDDEEREVVFAVERAIAGWNINEAMPDTFAPALYNLRLLLEGRGITLPATPADGHQSAAPDPE